MTKRQGETEQEYYARRRGYFKAHYQENRERRLQYQAEYYRRPGVRERVQEYGRVRYQKIKGAA